MLVGFLGTLFKDIFNLFHALSRLINSASRSTWPPRTFIEICKLNSPSVCSNTYDPFMHFERFCLSDPRIWDFISLIYLNLKGLHLPEKSIPLSHWEPDSHMYFCSDEGLDMLTNLWKLARFISVLEMALKLHTRWFMTPAKVHAFNPTFLTNYFWTFQDLSTFVHNFCSCNKLHPLWQ